MNKFAFLAFAGFLAFSGAANAQSFFVGGESIGSCHEDSPDGRPFQYLINGAGSANIMPGRSDANDHHAQLNLAIDPVSHRFVISGRVAHGGFAYLDGLALESRPAAQYMGDAEDWKGTLEASAPGQFISKDGASLQLTEKPAVSPLDGFDHMEIPVFGESAYSGKFTLADGSELKMTCSISKERLAAVDKRTRVRDLAGESLNPGIIGAARDPKTVTKSLGSGGTAAEKSGLGQLWAF